MEVVRGQRNGGFLEIEEQDWASGRKSRSLSESLTRMLSKMRGMG
jgi:hypothetical protein